jgi:protein involved in sex pheromone biosynthesis
MKKQITALILLLVLGLTILSGCTTQVNDQTSVDDLTDDQVDVEVIQDLDDSLIEDNYSVELGELI